jgi:hypothetical protein
MWVTGVCARAGGEGQARFVVFRVCCGELGNRSRPLNPKP